ncbi:SDR family NAD(P)-dependent oxidoreductase [Arthrobacter sp. KNU40]|uniref:SDR family NAD(P)-dependent oxidoreductase n=1 Tax=Arthrobacter sp. KNU40 TaxID=3447965 RepID=UPI003F614517
MSITQYTDLAQKAVVVTGGAGGIGSAASLALAAQGATVWVADIDLEAAQRVASEADSLGGRGRAVRLDVADPDSWRQLAAQVEKDGPLHGLVNNAGVSRRLGILDTSPEVWESVLAINLSGVFYGMKYLAPALSMAGSASIVNISSVFGLMGYVSATYTATKWGVRGLTKTAAAELADKGIRVNSLHPGTIETPLMWQGDDNAFIEAMLRTVPAGRTAQPEELARTIIFLLSDDSAYTTGAEIAVDGGMSGGGLSHRILLDSKPQATLKAQTQQ